MQKKVLIVDDETAICQVLSLALQSAGFDTLSVYDGRAAWQAVIDYQPDLVLLDWMLPEMSGIEVARRVRKSEEFAKLPIIMLSARGEEDSKITGLEVGADDYISKPFSSRELLSRVKAVLRRSSPETFEQQLQQGDLVLDSVSQRVKVAGLELSMGPTEYKLLEFFMRQPERVFSREQLLNRVWGSQAYVDERTVDVHILRLRKALKPAGLDGLIETVRGSGYRLAQAK